MKSYSDKLQDPRWQKKRLEILNRDNFECKLCYDNRTTLQVHHKEYQGKPWEIANDKLITVCAHCHDVIHSLPKESVFLVEKNVNIEINGWNIIAYTERNIYFMYFFFVSDNLHKAKYEIVTVKSLS